MYTIIFKTDRSDYEHVAYVPHGELEQTLHADTIESALGDKYDMDIVEVLSIFVGFPKAYEHE